MIYQVFPYWFISNDCSLIERFQLCDGALVYYILLYKMYTCGLHDMSTLCSPQGSGRHIRQTTSAHVTIIKITSSIPFFDVLYEFIYATKV